MNTVTLHIGDVRDVLERLTAEGVTADFAVTSPPFLALRSYLPADHPDKHRELGSEPTPAAFLDGCYGWTAQLGELLPVWASIAVEIGDTMSGSGGAGGDYNPDGLREGQPRFRQVGNREHRPPGDRKRGGVTECNTIGHDVPLNGGPGWPLAKSMCLIPHAYTIGLAYGHNPLTGQPTPAGQWRIRNVITWARPNPPVGSLGKRNPHRRTGDGKFRPACSFVTVACRGTGRYFDLDAVRTDYSPTTHARTANGVERQTRTAKTSPDGNRATLDDVNNGTAGAPPLDWHTDHLDGDWLWKLATAPYKGAHYATFPLRLPRRLIQAMCPERVCTVCGWPSERITEASTWPALATVPKVNDGGIGTHGDRCTASTTVGWTDCGHDAWRPGRTIDIFGGSGTTAVAAALEHRDTILIDIDGRNATLTDKRLRQTCNVTRQTFSRPIPRTDEEGRAGRTPTKKGGTIRPIWTITTWTIDGPRPADPKPPKIPGQTNLLDLIGASA